MQGDSLLPNLFILDMNMLSCMLSKAKTDSKSRELNTIERSFYKSSKVC